MKSRLSLLVLILPLLTLVSCEIFQQRPVTGEHFLCAADQGRTIAVRVGELISVHLLANPSTGFTWEWTRQSTTARSILRQIGESQYEASSEMPGAPGIMSFRFEVVRVGTEQLRLIYHRPWEVGVDPAQIYEVEVVASEVTSASTADCRSDYFDDEEALS